MSRGGRGFPLAAVLVAAGLLVLAGVAFAGCGGSANKSTGAHVTPASASTTTSSTHGEPAAMMSLQASYVSVIQRVAPDVVQISNRQGLGSGVVLDRHGDVVTNAHVVAGGGPLRVTDAGGRQYDAKLVGKFVPDDLAVVRAAGGSLPAASFADSRQLRVGDIVLAIGNPLGLRSSVTDGIVSALDRTVDEPDGAALPNVIQTSAAINPGNSGGALVDLHGDVVGIPTLAATDPQIGGAAPGIGFAVPSSLVTDIATQIVQHGHVVDSHRAYLGVSLEGGLVGGAVVASVQPGGPAARAGIAPGDVITSINGRPVTGPGDVADALATVSVGQTVKVGLTKPDGTHSTVDVTTGQYP